MRLRLLIRLLLFGCLAPAARADVAVFLEEPYSYDGALAGTGHAAIYLRRVCAASPTVLRRCQAGESGVVISRYHRIGGYDWLAIPLYPYLYAVERPGDIPLFADSKLEAALRDRYRRKYLKDIAPDGPDGTIPAGDWYELIGSAYDRTLYGLQIETTAEQDDKFIAAYNAGPNRAAYQLVTRNCADFVREGVNFYYPKATGRSVVADLDVSTPKHVAKSLAQYSKKHPDLQFTKFVIPQIPGSIRRSRPVHGLVDSVFTAKKYVVPLALLHPFVAGGVGVAYLTSGRFSPAKNAMVLTQDGDLERPLTKQERRAYEKGLAEVTKTRANEKPGSEEASWEHLLADAKLDVDDHGRPVLQVRTGGTLTILGITRDNVLDGEGPREVVQELLVARLREQLKGGRAPKTSEAELRRDWKLLKAAFASPEEAHNRESSVSNSSAGRTD
ncbi:MAG TPA: hypothetical protein VN780_08945 [Candidatus Eisenbacteria bacterium]|jgi:hypothetical protein|nr:hypothetical protein [Candidatus Eisenbacteria bacterium]